MSDEKNDKPAKAPKAEPAPQSEPERHTPAQWAVIRGHVNAKPKSNLRPGARTMRAWIYDSTKVHAGWGKRIAADVQLTGEQYDAAVEAACNVSFG